MILIDYSLLIIIWLLALSGGYCIGVHVEQKKLGIAAKKLKEIVDRCEALDLMDK